jgi:hypothetical protein
MAAAPSLTILDRFMLLALDDQTGSFFPLRPAVFDMGTAAAVLMDLMLLRRIDCDMRNVYVTNVEPTDDDLLDPVLRALALEPVHGATRAIRDEMQFLADEGSAFRERDVQRLIDGGVVRKNGAKIQRVTEGAFYGLRGAPVDIKARLIRQVTNGEIPDPDDIMLVALASACGLFGFMMNLHDLAQAAARISQLARLDLMGHALAKAVIEIEASIAMAEELG